MIDFKIIAVDFDGTLCEDKWPEIGEPNEKLIEYLRNVSDNGTGTKLILWTCRTGELLQNAINWCAERLLYFDAVNENVPEVLKWMGGDSRKIFADVYIDDKNFAKFKLPFVKEDDLLENERYEFPEWIYKSVTNPVWDSVFEQIEEALGFKLFFWQKTYIMGLGYRHSGQTTADILRKLAGDCVISGPIYLERPKNRMEHIYQNELIRIKRKLDDKGIISRSIERRKR